MEFVEQLNKTKAVGADLNAPEASAHVSTKYRAVPSVVAALIVPALFLAYIARYAVNVPVADEWLRIPLLDQSLHGHLTFGGLWAQYNETRIFLGNVIFVVFGFLDRFDVRALAFFNAAVFIVTYWLFLMVFRTYLGRRPGPLSVLVIGVVWFSLADSENPLFGFQVPWYLVVFFFVAMTYLLLVPNNHRNLVFFLGILAAIAASNAIIQGFVLWPVGLICLLWIRPWVRRTYFECGVWIAAAAVTAGVYSIGFNFHNQSCGPGGCTANFAFQHPAATFRFVLILVGNSFVPNRTQAGQIVFSTHFGDRELFGGLILFAAALVVALSLLERRTKRRLPLPVLLITFGVLYDVTVAMGRAYFEPGALVNRYVMPNLLILLGIVVYALAHIPSWTPINWRTIKTPINWRTIKRRGALRYVTQWAAVVTVGILLIIQSVIATRVGIETGRATEQAASYNAQVIANFDRIPRSLQGCELNLVVYLGGYDAPTALKMGLPLLAKARADELSVFQPAGYRALRRKGLPPLMCASQK
jgi:hypothetical protein